jgi:hypothetical protein
MGRLTRIAGREEGRPKAERMSTAVADPCVGYQRTIHDNQLIERA